VLARLCGVHVQGELEIGETVVPMYVDQSRDVLDPNKTVSVVGLLPACSRSDPSE